MRAQALDCLFRSYINSTVNSEMCEPFGMVAELKWVEIVIEYIVFFQNHGDSSACGLHR